MRSHRGLPQRAPKFCTRISSAALNRLRSTVKDRIGGRWQISNEGGTEARWVRPDEIVYMKGTKLMSGAVKSDPTFSAATPQRLFERNLADFDISRDGRIPIVEAPDPSQSTGRLNVVVN